MRDLIAGILLLACFTVLLFSVIALIVPLPKLKLPTRKSAVKGLGLALGLFVATAIVIPKDASNNRIAKSEQSAKARPDSEKGTVLASNRKIAEVNVTPETKFANIKIDLAAIWSDASLPSHAAMIVEDIGKAVKKGASDVPPEIETINFWFTGPTIDQYGNDDRSTLLQFRIKTSDLRLMNYGKLPPQSLLEFAYDIQVSVPARSGVEEYCAENRSTNRNFCIGR